jgi:outer membrane protein assembly factor BamE (lipoprotein component of BamABCDE complex)
MALPGCFMNESSIDLPLNAEAIAKLQIGVSTAQQVAETLGAPRRVVELGEGYAWLYEHTSQKSAGLFLLLIGLYGNDEQTDRCWVFFDSTGVLRQMGSTLMAEESEYILPGF